MTLVQDQLTRHPLSTQFLEMSPSDKAELLLSMQDHGYDKHYPIILLDGQILDGWHRYEAAQKARIEPTFEVFSGSVEEAKHFVLAANLARRHLTSKQKAAALIVMNASLPPSQQLTDAQIGVRCGLRSQQLANQLARVDKMAPHLLGQVANGELDANEVIRDNLKEDPKERRGRPSISDGRKRWDLHLSGKERIVQLDQARLRASLGEQAMMNKMAELFLEWVERNHC